MQRGDDARDARLLADAVLAFVLDSTATVPDGEVDPLEPVLERKVVPGVLVGRTRGRGGRERVRDEQRDVVLAFAGRVLSE